MAGSNNVVQISFAQTIGGVKPVNVQNWKQLTSDTNPYAQAQLQKLVDNLSLAFGAWKVIAVDKWEYLGAIGTEMLPSIVDTGEDPPFPYKFPRGRQASSILGATFGSVAQDYLPTFNAAVYQLKTAFAGRRNRGSQHMVGVADVAQEGQFLKPATITAVQAFADSMMTAVSFVDGGVTFNFLPVVTSYNPTQKGGPAGVNTASISNFVQTQPVTKKVGTMKRRKFRGSVSLF